MEITVVIPVWDHYAQWLEECIASIREDSSSVDILVVDNASMVPMPRINEPVLRLPQRVSIGECRNRGLEHVTSSHVIFWDVDDLLLPGTFTALTEAIGDAVAATGRIIGWDEATGQTMKWGFPPPWAEQLSKLPRLFAWVGMTQCIFPTTGPALLDVAAVRACGGFPDTHLTGQDWALGSRLAWFGHIVLTDHPARLYRIHDQSRLAT